MSYYEIIKNYSSKLQSDKIHNLYKNAENEILNSKSDETGKETEENCVKEFLDYIINAVYSRAKSWYDIKDDIAGIIERRQFLTNISFCKDIFNAIEKFEKDNTSRESRVNNLTNLYEIFCFKPTLLSPLNCDVLDTTVDYIDNAKSRFIRCHYSGEYSLASTFSRNILCYILAYLRTDKLGWDEWSVPNQTIENHINILFNKHCISDDFRKCLIRIKDTTNAGLHVFDAGYSRNFNSDNLIKETYQVLLYFRACVLKDKAAECMQLIKKIDDLESATTYFTESLNYYLKYIKPEKVVDLSRYGYGDIYRELGKIVPIMYHGFYLNDYNIYKKIDEGIDINVSRIALLTRCYVEKHIEDEFKTNKGPSESMEGFTTYEKIDYLEKKRYIDQDTASWLHKLRKQADGRLHREKVTEGSLDISLIYNSFKSQETFTNSYSNIKKELTVKYEQLLTCDSDIAREYKDQVIRKQKEKQEKYKTEIIKKFKVILTIGCVVLGYAMFFYFGEDISRGIAGFLRKLFWGR